MYTFRAPQWPTLVKSAAPIVQVQVHWFNRQLEHAAAYLSKQVFRKIQSLMLVILSSSHRP